MASSSRSVPATGSCERFSRTAFHIVWAHSPSKAAGGRRDLQAASLGQVDQFFGFGEIHSQQLLGIDMIAGLPQAFDTAWCDRGFVRLNTIWSLKS
jgi:hypothetical protein